MEPKRKQPWLVAKTARLAGGPLSQKNPLISDWQGGRLALFESTRWQAESFTLLGPPASEAVMFEPRK